MKTILIAGLGNPGKEYAATRHNAGFMFADYFFEKFRDEFGFSPWEEKKKLKSLVSAGIAAGTKIILMKPLTFMNLSGEAVISAMKYFKVDLEDLSVVHDEIDLPLGTFRFSTNSSSAGHNGAGSIIESIGSQNFTRLRIGVDNRGENKIETEKYVLGKFTDTELGVLRKTLEDAANKLFSEIKK